MVSFYVAKFTPILKSILVGSLIFFWNMLHDGTLFLSHILPIRQFKKKSTSRLASTQALWNSAEGSQCCLGREAWRVDTSFPLCALLFLYILNICTVA